MTNSKEVPTIPPLMPEEKRIRENPEPNPVVARCGECGLDIRQTMGYVCGNINCPVFPKVTC